MKKNTQTKTYSFMGNVAIILLAQIMVKVLGLVYRMVITNINGFGDTGNGFYNAGFQVYTVLLAISSVGIPNAIAKMVSERAALEDFYGAHRIFKTALKLFSVIGIICSVILYIGSDFIAVNIMNMDGAQYVMRALSPSLFFVCVSSVIRGYFQGLNDMRATSFSQMLEQIFKCSLTILFVVLTVGVMPKFMQIVTSVSMLYNGSGKTPPEIMAAWANAASSAASMISLLYLALFYWKNRQRINDRIAKGTAPEKTVSSKKLITMILALSIPISLASIITAVNRVIDLATITRQLEIAFANGIPQIGSLAAVANPTPADLNHAAVTLSGMLSKSDTLFNMPLALNIAFATVLVPSISGALAKGDTKEASEKTSYSFLISILLILPCAIGYMVLSYPIYRIIYPGAPDGAGLLSVMAVALLFSALTQTLTGALQGIGKTLVPAIAILIGCVFKITLNILLIRIPSINIYGAAISSIACQLAAFLVNFIVLIKYIPIKISLKKYILKPLLAGIATGVSAILVYLAATAVAGNGYVANLISTFAAIAVAAVVYITVILFTHTMNKEEILLLPAGGRIYGLLTKLKIYKEEKYD